MKLHRLSRSFRSSLKRTRTLVPIASLAVLMLALAALVLTLSLAGPTESHSSDEPNDTSQLPQTTADPTPYPTPEPTAHNNNEIEEETTPSTSIQELVDRASEGDTVMIPAGIYREQVTIDKPLSLNAEPGAEIRGSDVWSDWSNSGAQWISQNSVPEFDNNHGRCTSSAGDSCRWQEQVFVDGQPLEQVQASPGNGQFTINRNGQVVLGQDPNDSLVEVSIREFWIQGESSDVVVEGFVMKHAANRAQQGAINNGGHDDWLIRGNSLSYAHGANVSLYEGTNLQLVDNDISYSGQLGIHGTSATDVQIVGNRIYENNQASYRRGWDAGGLKVTQMRGLTIDGNEVFSNNGPGLWCDIDCDDVTISNNDVYQNRSAGIIYEISRNARIFGNVVWDNHSAHRSWGWGAGIRVQNSRDTEVFENIVAWNGDGISVISQDRENDEWNDVVNVTVRDNKIFSVATQSHHDFALAWLEDWDGVMFESSSNNQGANNAYYHWNPDDSYRVFTWDSSEYTFGDLESFNETPGEEDGRYLSEDEKDQILESNGIPTSSPR